MGSMGAWVVADATRRRWLLVASVLCAALPALFGLVRAVNTGNDFRYLWLAASAIVGSLAARLVWPRAPGPRRMSVGRAVGAVAAGTACAAATAVFLGATPGPGLAIVAGAFGLCTGASVTLARYAK